MILLLLHVCNSTTTYLWNSGENVHAGLATRRHPLGNLPNSYDSCLMFKEEKNCSISCGLIIEAWLCSCCCCFVGSFEGGVIAIACLDDCFLKDGEDAGAP